MRSLAGPSDRGLTAVTPNATGQALALTWAPHHDAQLPTLRTREDVGPSQGTSRSDRLAQRSAAARPAHGCSGLSGLASCAWTPPRPGRRARALGTRRGHAAPAASPSHSLSAEAGTRDSAHGHLPTPLLRHCPWVATKPPVPGRRSALKTNHGPLAAERALASGGPFTARPSPSQREPWEDTVPAPSAGPAGRGSAAPA